MTLGGRICPYCKKYTAKNEARCLHCDKYLGPEFFGAVVRYFKDNPIWATSTLVALNVLVFFGELILAVGSERPPPSPLIFALSPIPTDVLLRFGALPFGSPPLTDAFRLICACYIHINGLHILANMFALLDIGRMLEPQIKGPRMIVAFTVTGVLGFVASQWWYSDAIGLTAGASGAVFGVQGVMLGQLLAAKDKRFASFLWRTVGYSVVFYYVMRTNQAAHMGGLFVGIALGYVFGKEKRPWQREVHFWVLATLCMLLTVAALVTAQWTHLHVPVEGLAP